MDEVPPPEAFEPQPDEPVRAGRGRRRLQVAIAVVVIVALVGLAAVENSGIIVRPEVSVTPAVVPTMVVVDSAGTLATVDGQGASVVPYPVPDVRFQFPAFSPDGVHIAAIGQGADGSGVYVFRVRSPGGDRHRSAGDLQGLRPAAVLPLLDAGWHARDIPHDRARRHRAADRPGGREQRGDGRSLGCADVLGFRGSRATARAQRNRSVGWVLRRGRGQRRAVRRDGSPGWRLQGARGVRG